jgi:Flavin containing amine oxidoreductase
LRIGQSAIGERVLEARVRASRQPAAPTNHQAAIHNPAITNPQSPNPQPAISNQPSSIFNEQVLDPRSRERFKLTFLDKGRMYFAGEHTCPAFVGYMEGALQSGVRAASAIMKA